MDRTIMSVIVTCELQGCVPRRTGGSLPLAPTPQQQANLAGGLYTVELSRDTPSFINLPLAAPRICRASSTDWGPSS
jgi:hypothetical protein